METIEKSPELLLWERKKLRLGGIEDVTSFDEVSVYLITKNGNLLIEGTELHITVLDVTAGNMEIEGHIRAMIYSDKESVGKGGLFAKVFK